MFQLSDDRRAIQAAARDLSQRIFRDLAAEIDRTEEYPSDNVAGGLWRAGVRLPRCRTGG